MREGKLLCGVEKRRGLGEIMIFRKKRKKYECYLCNRYRSGWKKMMLTYHRIFKLHVHTESSSRLLLFLHGMLIHLRFYAIWRWKDSLRLKLLYLLHRLYVKQWRRKFCGLQKFRVSRNIKDFGFWGPHRLGFGDSNFLLRDPTLICTLFCFFRRDFSLDLFFSFIYLFT